MRGRVSWAGLSLLILMALVAVATAVASVATNAATNVAHTWPMGLEVVRVHPFRWMFGASLVGLAASVGIWRLQGAAAHRSLALAPTAYRPDPWVVDRPSEVDCTVQALCRKAGVMAGITTALFGAGGFGKTTIARLIQADGRIIRYFSGRVFWVTMGRDVTTDAAITNKINDLIKRIDPGRAMTFTSAQQASEYLAALLDTGPRRLIILDDVWHAEQLTPFELGGQQCARLVTTRNLSLVAQPAMLVEVDQLSDAQARAVLGWELPKISATTVDTLLAETGRWPLLLRLVNKILAGQVRINMDLEEAAVEVRQRLRHHGALSVDELTGEARYLLDVSDPDKRQRAVRATIEASTGLLDIESQDRFAELAVFAEDETILIELAARLWRGTGGLDRLASGRLSELLHDLALVSLTATVTGGAITMHNVIRDYLRNELGPAREATLHGTLLDAVASNVPTAEETTAYNCTCATAWWQLPDEDQYLWEHLIEHLLAAGRKNEASHLAGDLRWVAARLVRFSTAAPYGDLALTDSPYCDRLRAVLAQIAHLLGPTEPASSQIDILYSRVAHDDEWGPQAAALASARTQPRLVNVWPLPDMPESALRRAVSAHTPVFAVALSPDGTRLICGGEHGILQMWNVVTGDELARLIGHIGSVRTLAVSPDGTWLASGGEDGSIRLWDMVTGDMQAEFADRVDSVSALVASANGAYLISGGHDGTVRIRDVVTGEARMVIHGRTGRVAAVASSPDGTWIASVGRDGIIRIWDAVTGSQTAAMHGHQGGVTAIAVSPDGAWLASAGQDSTVRIWDPVTGNDRAVFSGPSGWVNTVAISPDGSWLTSAGDDGMIWVWDLTTGRESAILPGHSSIVNAIAVSSDGAWLAAGDLGGTVRVWDVAIGLQRGTMTRLLGHTSLVETVAVSPDSTWLVIAGYDQIVRVWDVATRRELAAISGHAEIVKSVAISPDGLWLASGSSDGTIRVWDSITYKEKAILTGHTGAVNTIAASPDGTWLVSGGYDGTIRVWDIVRCGAKAVLTGHASAVNTVAVSPDGTWLVSGGQDGTLRTWNSDTGDQHNLLEGHTGPVHTVTVSPDGTWIASGGFDGLVRLWNIANDGTRIKSLNAHTGIVNAVAISPDGDWLVSVGSDRTVRVWNVIQRRVAAMMRIDNQPNACTWMPDSSTIAVGGTAGVYLFALLGGHNI